MINLEEEKKRAATFPDRTRREETLVLLAEIERLQKKASALYATALAIADRVAEEEGFGAEFDEEGFMEVSLHKEDIESFFAVVYNWNH